MSDPTETPTTRVSSPVLSRRLRASFSWHVWLDNGESWTAKELPPVQTTVTCATATEAAVEAYNRLRHLHHGERAKFIVKCVDDPMVGSEKPFWLVEVEPRPAVIDVSATTLADLCEDDYEFIKDPQPGQVCATCGVDGAKHNARHPFKVLKAVSS